ncbi:response regulator receiver domain-containing protein [Acidipila rosea]|uniref:Response regulator receiver domain-containing protein n=1 Tax=Acidipila rosea TaxID=768535 RepID=A0A4R1LAD2_9BACT|nr:response regulator receiver domain-containing protein [Acidipila rosea]
MGAERHAVAKILCVDDDPAVIVLKTAILEQAGHTVRSCSTADDAIRLLEEERFDAVVTDWRLGDGRGRTIVEAAKSRFSVPVVVVSGYVGEAFQAAEPLADLYLEKPADPRELVQVVDALLRTRRDSASLGI